jgi:hypothetical protein
VLLFLFCLGLVEFGSGGIFWFFGWFWLVVVVRICSKRLSGTFDSVPFRRKAFPDRDLIAVRGCR